MQTEDLVKTRYTDSELAEFEAILLEKIKLAKGQLEFYRQQIAEQGEGEGSRLPSIDDGSISVESERLQIMAARQASLIQHLENARMRVKNKVYGICRDTGKLISRERLLAVPHATLSIEAKQKKK